MQPTQLYWLECSESELPAHEAWLSTAEQACIRDRWIPKRRHDWLLGRWTAKCALARYLAVQLDVHALRSFAILPAGSGAPVAFRNSVPMDLSLSISHRDGRALAVIGSPELAVGCDLETTEPRSDTFVQQFLTITEIEQLERTNSPGSESLGTLIWSAKETVLKMLGVGLSVDTRSVAITVDTAQPTASWQNFSAHLVDGRRFAGWWQRDATTLRTMAASVATSTPLALNVFR